MTRSIDDADRFLRITTGPRANELMSEGPRHAGDLEYEVAKLPRRLDRVAHVSEMLSALFIGPCCRVVARIRKARVLRSQQQVERIRGIADQFDLHCSSSSLPRHPAHL